MAPHWPGLWVPLLLLVAAIWIIVLSAVIVRMRRTLTIHDEEEIPALDRDLKAAENDIANHAKSIQQLIRRVNDLSRGPGTAPQTVVRPPVPPSGRQGGGSGGRHSAPELDGKEWHWAPE